jgi:hypothetical protein
MRYADGGGLTMEGRSRRERVRLQAAEMFEHGEDARAIASSLRVSTKSVYQWRRAWQAPDLFNLMSVTGSPYGRLVAW